MQHFQEQAENVKNHFQDVTLSLEREKWEREKSESYNLKIRLQITHQAKYFYFANTKNRPKEIQNDLYNYLLYT